TQAHYPKPASTRINPRYSLAATFRHIRPSSPKSASEKPGPRMRIACGSLLLMLVGCADGLFGPKPDQAIEIEVAARSTSETSLLVGEQIALTVGFRGRVGDRNVAWRSDNPEIV